MRALVGTGDSLVVEEVADPVPQRGEALVEVDACGICGSDVHIYEGGSFRRGHILGHEFSGRVIALGEGVDGMEVGTPIAVNPLGGCGTCEACQMGLPFLCRERPNIGLSAPGGFAELVCAPVGQLYALPSGSVVERGAHAEPLSVARHGIALAAPLPGDDALVIGDGSIGLSAVLALRAMGAGRVVVIGLAPARLAAAAVAGADEVIDARTIDMTTYFADLGPTFANVFECSGARDAARYATVALRSNGTLVQLGFGSELTTVDTRMLVGRNLRIIGSCAFGPDEYAGSVELIANGLDVDALVSDRIPLEGVVDMFERLLHPSDVVKAVVKPALRS